MKLYLVAITAVSSLSGILAQGNPAVHYVNERDSILPETEHLVHGHFDYGDNVLVEESEDEIEDEYELDGFVDAIIAAAEENGMDLDALWADWVDEKKAKDLSEPVESALRGKPGDRDRCWNQCRGTFKKMKIRGIGKEYIENLKKNVCSAKCG